MGPVKFIQLLKITIKLYSVPLCLITYIYEFYSQRTKSYDNTIICKLRFVLIIALTEEAKQTLLFFVHKRPLYIVLVS